MFGRRHAEPNSVCPDAAAPTRREMEVEVENNIGEDFEALTTILTEYPEMNVQNWDADKVREVVSVYEMFIW